MDKILMILTSHRLDCFQLTMDQLKATGALQQFDRVVLLLNGVVGKHQQYVDDLIAGNPDVPWDTVSGPRGKGKFVANPQNECVKRYPDSLYFKIDEDIIVPPGWVDKLTAAYDHSKEDPKRGLITPLVSNNSTGAHYLLNAYPELAEEYTRIFGFEITNEVTGPVWKYPQVAEWIIRKFLDLDAANKQLEQRIADGAARYETFDQRFSINNLVYDYAHWQELGGIPDDEEPAWTQWVKDHGKHNILACDTLLHHYSFFVQQDWLDRTNLLEDIRNANRPELPAKGFGGYSLPRYGRIARQLPRVIKRRLGMEK